MRCRTPKRPGLMSYRLTVPASLSVHMKSCESQVPPTFQNCQRDLQVATAGSRGVPDAKGELLSKKALFSLSDHLESSLEK